MRTYIALSVWLDRVPEGHVSANRSKQFTILIRTTSQKRVADLLGSTSLFSLRTFSGIRRAPDAVGFHKERKNVAGIVQKDHTVYYNHDNQWFEYPPTQP